MFKKTPRLLNVILLYFCCNSFVGFAQISKPSFSFGPIINDADHDHHFSKFIGENDNGIYALREGSNTERHLSYVFDNFNSKRINTRRTFGNYSELSLVKFNHDLSPVAVFSLDYPGKMSTIFMLEGKIILITSDSDESGEVFIDGHIINDQTMSIEKTERLLYFPMIKGPSFSYSRYKLYCNFKVDVLAEDGLFVLLTMTDGADEVPGNKSSLVYNTRMGFTSDFGSPDKNSLMKEPVFSIEHKVENKSVSSQYDFKKRVVYEVKKYDLIEGDAIDTFQLETRRHLTMPILKEREGKVFITALVRTDPPLWNGGYKYQQDVETEDYNGIFLACYDLEREVFDYSEIKPISKSFMRMVMGKKALKKMSKHGPGIKGLRLLDVEIKSNGGLYVVGEQRYSKESTMPKLAKENDVWSNYNYSCKDIVIASFSEKGSLEWMNRIKKDQKFKGFDREYVSFFGMTSQDDQIYIYYNDLKENRRLEEGQKAKPFKVSNLEKVLYQAHIDPEGNLKKTILIDNPSNFKISMAARIQDGKDDSVVLFTKKGSSERLARLQF